MKKIIFLDFDGVLNTEHYQNYLMYQRQPWQDKHGAFFDPEAVRQLKRIVDITKADIVIESSWKIPRSCCYARNVEGKGFARQCNRHHRFDSQR